MARLLLILLLLIINTGISVSQPIIIVLIRFDDSNEGVQQSKLSQIESRLADELENMGYVVVVKSKDTWEVEESYGEKRDFVVSYNGQYSIELNFAKIPSELSIELKNWTDQSFNLPAKPIKSGRLTKYSEPVQLQALAIEWARDASYFIKNNKIKRPEIAVDDFVKGQDNIDQKVVELMLFVKNNLPYYYLNTNISNCMKLKQFELFEQCTSMRGLYRLSSNALNITVEFENPDGQKYSFTNPNLPIPKNESENKVFIKRFIDSIVWPENIACND